ncbi:MAG: laccase domain-containing protein, partial [Pseudomonadota bacterium]|nr:laccase domain-containing protein [Pseudomonadota bacterium]
VLEATVRAMTRLGATQGRITAAVGPCIARESYEVGSEFHAEFIAESTYNARFFSAAPREGHFMFDLPGYITKRLAALGLGAVDAVIADTCGDEARFFSYRRATQRGETNYGLGLSAIVLET